MSIDHKATSQYKGKSSIVVLSILSSWFVPKLISMSLLENVAAISLFFISLLAITFFFGFNYNVRRNQKGRYFFMVLLVLISFSSIFSLLFLNDKKPILSVPALFPMFVLSALLANQFFFLTNEKHFEFS